MFYKALSAIIFVAMLSPFVLGMIKAIAGA